MTTHMLPVYEDILRSQATISMKAIATVDSLRETVAFWDAEGWPDSEAVRLVLKQALELSGHDDLLADVPDPLRRV